PLHGPSSGTGKRYRAGSIVLGAADRRGRGGGGEVTANVTGIEFDRVQSRVHVKPGVPGKSDHCSRGIDASKDASVAAFEQQIGRALDKGKGMMVHVHHVAAAIPTGQIIKSGACATCQPSVEGVDKNAVRVI